MSIKTPFEILIDTAEQLPFPFIGIRADAEHDYALWDVQTARVCLGRHPDSLGDYSVTGGIGRCHVERKSMADAHTTLLGFTDGHRKRFEAELANLAKIESALVVVECSFEEFVCNAPEWGQKSNIENAKNLFRSVLALQQDTKVPWQFAGDRATAEQVTFHW
ncbi:MAG: hypothetical protein ACTHK7_11505, partial [Aureliella sp.]